MNNYARLAIAAVAVIAVGAAGLVALGDLGPAASAPTLGPTPRPTTSPTVVQEFRTPFSYVLPEGAEFDYGTRNETWFEVRVPAAFEAGHPAGVIIQAIRAGRVDPCDASSAALPIEGGPEGIFDYLRAIPGITVLNESQNVDVDGLVGRQATVTATAGAMNCDELWAWFENTESFVTDVQLRLIAVDVGAEHLVLTIFGEAESEWWPALANQLIYSLDFGTPLPAVEMRVEPGGQPTVVAATPGVRMRKLEYPDAGGDVTVDLVDVTQVSFKSPCYAAAICVYFDLAGSSDEPLNDPATDWVAYGLMIDSDADGVADVQAGIDNGNRGPRTWWIDLETGETESIGGMQMLDRSVEAYVTFLRVAEAGPLRGWIGVNRTLAEPELHFYLWASIIRDGAVVATDFAPDGGWLDGYQQ